MIKLGHHVDLARGACPWCDRPSSHNVAARVVLHDDPADNLACPELVEQRHLGQVIARNLAEIADTLDSVEKTEAYCLASGHPVRPGAGDRCVAHGAAAAFCETGFRFPQCRHPRWPREANGSARCPECGVIVGGAR